MVVTIAMSFWSLISEAGTGRAGVGVVIVVVVADGLLAAISTVERRWTIGVAALVAAGLAGVVACGGCGGALGSG